MLLCRNAFMQRGVPTPTRARWKNSSCSLEPPTPLEPLVLEKPKRSSPFCPSEGPPGGRSGWPTPQNLVGTLFCVLLYSLFPYFFNYILLHFIIIYFLLYLLFIISWCLKLMILILINENIIILNKFMILK